MRSYDLEKLHEVNRMECDLLERQWASKECIQALSDYSERHRRKLQLRLSKLDGHDYRLIGDRVERLEEELREHTAMQAQLPPPPPPEEYPELEDGYEDLFPASRQVEDGQPNEDMEQLEAGEAKTEEKEEEKEIPPASTGWRKWHF